MSQMGMLNVHYAIVVRKTSHPRRVEYLKKILEKITKEIFEEILEKTLGKFPEESFIEVKEEGRIFVKTSSEMIKKFFLVIYGEMIDEILV